MKKNDDSTDILIYHYCNEFVLNSILENKKIWLSDINFMKDSTELKWARDLFIKVLTDNKSIFEQEFRFYIIHSVFELDNNALPLIGCFSLDGDLLSQWKDYGENGEGFSIGFSSKLIYEGLGVNIYPITYDENKQYEIILNELKGIYEEWKRNDKDYGSISMFSAFFSVDLNYLKNPCFKKEKEVRIVRLIVKNSITKKFEDIGGKSDIKRIEPLEVKTRKKDSEDILYVELPIDIPTDQVIKEIVLGPKCSIDSEWLSVKLKMENILNVEIKKSKIPYR